MAGWTDYLAAAKKRNDPGLAYFRPEDEGYPYMTSGPMVCSSLLAAYSRAKQQGEAAIATRALTRAKREGCDWAVKQSGK
jgi:hypothetical protein